MSADEPRNAPAVEAVALCKSFSDRRRGTIEALVDVDLSCARGEVFGVLGPNGAGKTTMLRILATILSPTSGRATVGGIDVIADPLEARRRIGFLSGTTGLYPRLTPRETLAYFGQLHGIEARALRDRIEELIDAFGMRAFADGRCEALSTGQKQSVSIARAVLHDPPVLILDEPTTGLDILARSAMLAFIASRRAAGTCVLFSTHVLSEAEALCDRIGVIIGGRMIAAGTLSELCARTGEDRLDDVFRVLVRASGSMCEDGAAGA